MSMLFQCPFCSYIIKGVSRNMLGMRLECPSCGQLNDLPEDSYAPGRVIGGDFLIKSKLGEGSIGVVFRAWQISLERQVALKVLNSDYTNAKGIAAFLYEARAAAELDHINIVKCFAVGDENGVCYMAMNFVKGETLKDLLVREGRIPVDEALHIIQQVAEALHYSWSEAKLIHRDIKPENIMINEEGIVKLTDLGLALKQKDWDKDMEISGSPSYMSPEQFAGELIDTRADIYSLGVTLYQLLSGELPFKAETLRSLAKQHFQVDAKRLNKVDSSIPSEVANLVRKMMAKAVDDRFQSMDELLFALWKVRQRTAPDKELVPGIHTISMKRLDYDLQKKSSRRKMRPGHEASDASLTQTSTLISTYKRRRSMYVTVAVTVAVLLLLGGAAAYYLSASYQVKPLTSKVDEISMSLGSANPDLEELERLCQQASDELGQPGDLSEHLLSLRIALYTSMVGAKKQEKANKALKEQLLEMRLQADKAAGEARKIEERRFNKILAVKEDGMNAKIARLEEWLEQARDDNDALKQKLGKLSNTLQSRESDITEYDRQWMKTTSSKAYKAVMAGGSSKSMNRFFRDLVNEDIPERRRDWLRSQMRTFQGLGRLYRKISSENSAFVNCEIQEGKIVMANDGVFVVQAAAGAPAEMSWDRLGYDSVLSLFKKDPAEPDDDDLKARVAIITGKLAAARDVFNANSQYDSLVEALVSDDVEAARLAVVTDKAQAQKIADGALKKYKGLKAFEPFREEMHKLSLDGK